MPPLDELRREIDRDEPDYPALARELGEDALPQLHQLVAEDEPRIASKAAYLAAVIAGPSSKNTVEQAAQSRHDVVRSAAAAALPALPPEDAEHAAGIANRLMSDPDVTVRARAAKSAATLGSPALADSLRRMAENDDHDSLRDLAGGLADEMAGD